MGLDLGLGMQVRLRADSSAAQGICHRTGIGKVRHLAVSQLWVQERLREGTFTLHKCLGASNPADLLTKYLDKVKVEQCLSTMAVLSEAGRAATAPQLAAEVEAYLAEPEAPGAGRADRAALPRRRPAAAARATPRRPCSG